MARRQKDGRWRPVVIVVTLATFVCAVVFLVLTPLFSPPAALVTTVTNAVEAAAAPSCCQGIAQQEFWGDVVKSGSDLKANSSHECCLACKAMCPARGSCICNSWVYCGDSVLCKEKLGECWLKKQKDVLEPDLRFSGKDVAWTSGLVYGPKMGIVAMETSEGSIHIKLLPDCAPKSVAYVRELLKMRHCAGCQIVRAEGRGDVWDEDGNVMKEGSVGPPYALIQGILAAQGKVFHDIPKESPRVVERGMIGWVDSGPNFFISLANHEEWLPKHTIFGYVLPQHMRMVEDLAKLPTVASSWSGVNVAVLKKPVRIVRFVKPEQRAMSHKLVFQGPVYRCLRISEYQSIREEAYEGKMEGYFCCISLRRQWLRICH